MSATVLSLDAVDAGYRADPVLVDVSLELQRGEVVGVVAIDAWGGKSTLLRAAAGLLPPRRGRVRFEGDDVYAMGFGQDQRFRARVGWVPEGGGLLVNQSVWENVALPLRYHLGLRGRELEVRVARLLEQAGFADDARRFPWQVSGRDRRLAAFARALARGPSLVLVDDFIAGLETPDKKRLFELVLELNHSEGTAWLLGCDLDPAIFQVAERVLVLEKGRVLALGARRQLYREPRIQAAFDAAREEAEAGARRTARPDPAKLRAALARDGGPDPGRVGARRTNSPLRSEDSGVELVSDEAAAAGRAVEAAADLSGSGTVIVDGHRVGALRDALRAAPRGDDPERTAALDAPAPASTPSPGRRPARALDDDDGGGEATLTLNQPVGLRGQTLDAQETITIDGAFADDVRALIDRTNDTRAEDPPDAGGPSP